MAQAPAAGVRPDRATLAAFAGVVLFGGVNAIAVKKSVAERRQPGRSVDRPEAA